MKDIRINSIEESKLFLLITKDLNRKNEMFSSTYNSKLREIIGDEIIILNGLLNKLRGK